MDHFFLAEVTIDWKTGAVSHGFTFEHFLVGLMWGVWVVLNLWIWKKTKALGNLLMLCGAAALSLCFIIRAFTWGPGYWIDFLAIGALTVGFFFSVKPLVDAQLKALKDKLHNATAGKKDGGAPPHA